MVAIKEVVEALGRLNLKTKERSSVAHFAGCLFFIL